jgi:hypothetical protein
MFSLVNFELQEEEEDARSIQSSEVHIGYAANIPLFLL